MSREIGTEGERYRCRDSIGHVWIGLVILAGLVAAPAASAPVLVLSPTAGPGGTWVTATGSGYNVAGIEFAQATILFNGIVVAQNVWFAGNGFSTSFQVPSGTSQGSHTVQAVGPRDTATAIFTMLAPPKAGFSMNPSSGRGEAPLTVYFADRSAGDPDSWQWSFGDGTYSSLQNPERQYPSPGAYTVTLSVSNAAGSSQSTQSVTVYKPELVISPASGKPGTIVTVTGSSFDLYGVESLQGQVTFDGLVVSSYGFTRQEGSLGSFSASFVVPDGTSQGDHVIRAIGPRNTEEGRFRITNTAPHPIIDGAPLSGRTPLTVSFNGGRSYDEDGSIQGYRWNFGDGSAADGVTAEHTYRRPGEYRVVLTVTDNQDGSESVALTVSVQNTPPSADARATPTSGPDPLAVRFDGSASRDPDGSIRTYRWDFGDGFSDDGARVTHVYQDPRSYHAILTVTDDGGLSARGEVTITVGNTPPVAVLSVTPQSGKRPLAVQADGSRSSDPDDPDLTYFLDFGDGTSGIGKTATHTYEKEGTYHVSLTVTDPHGASHRAETTVVVEDPFPAWVLVAGGLGGIVVAEEIIRNRPRTFRPGDRLPVRKECPRPAVQVDVQSGVEYGGGGEGPDVSVEVRSGIWKEGEER